MGADLGSSMRGRLVALVAVGWVVAAGGEGSSPRVALTFDDGPRPTFVPRALDILDQFHAQATFFNVGMSVKRYPKLAAACVARGHELGNHSYSHPRLTMLTPARLRSEITRTNEAILSAAGVRPRYLRPPYGAVAANVRTAARETTMSVAMWTIDPYDWQHSASAERTARRVLSAVRPGSVILLHEVAPTLAALPTILRELTARGYQVVSLYALNHPDEEPAAPLEPVPPPRYIHIRCGSGIDDEAWLAPGCGYVLEQGFRVPELPGWLADDMLLFKLLVPRAVRGNLRIQLADPRSGPPALQRVIVNSIYVGTFEGSTLVTMPMFGDLTEGGTVVVRVDSTNGRRPGVSEVSFTALGGE